MKLGIFLVLVSSVTLAAATHAAEPRIYHVMLLTGQSNHNWKATTPVLEAIFKETGRFEVTVVTTPPAGAEAAAWEAFRPDFSKYDAIVSNWGDYGAKWAADAKLPMPWMTDLLQYVHSGGAFVVIHAAGISKCPEYSKLAGLMWQEAKADDRLTLDDNGKPVRTPKGQGPGSGHGKRFEWPLTMWAADHPVCAGLPSVWMHAEDELWFGTRGPAENIQILATAVAPQTKQNEPIIWTVNYGKGRAFVTVMGHDPKAMSCIGFRTILTRGCEWAITGAVTLPTPVKFPEKNKVLTVDQGVKISR